MGAGGVAPDRRPATSVMPTRRRLGFRYLHVVDAVSLFGLMVAITVARFGLDWPTYPLSHYAIGFGVATALHMVVYYFGGLYEYEQRLGRPPWMPRAAMLTLVAVGLAGGVALLTGRYLMPRANLVVLAVAATLVVVFNRDVARRVRSRRFGAPRVLLMGDRRDVAMARRHLHESEPDAQVTGEASADASGLLAEVERAQATDVLLLSSSALDSVYPEPLGRLDRRLVGVYRRVTPADTLLGLQRTRQIGGMPFVALRVQAVPTCRLRFKRLTDVIYLLVLAPVAIPLVLVVAGWVRIVAGSGVLYRQRRVGLRGREFTMVKFRTMTTDAESDGREVLASADDPRVLRGLAWLRRTRLDELPQLWNVATGAMSLVGPRPERPDRVAELSARIGGYERRHDMPPGITGLAQTLGHYQTDPAFKLGHDLQYVLNWSPVLDWEIMAKSVWVMARRSAR